MTTSCIYVTNRNINEVTVYAKGASGNVAPLGKLSGSKTGLNNPVGIFVDFSAKAHVANYDAVSVTVYAAGAKGNVSPIRIISGANTQLNGPSGSR